MLIWLDMVTKHAEDLIQALIPSKHRAWVVSCQMEHGQMKHLHKFTSMKESYFSICYLKCLPTKKRIADLESVIALNTPCIYLELISKQFHRLSQVLSSCGNRQRKC